MCDLRRTPHTTHQGTSHVFLVTRALLLFSNSHPPFLVARALLFAKLPSVCAMPLPAEYQYVLVSKNTKTCIDAGHEYVDTLAECDIAAAAVGHKDTSAEELRSCTGGCPKGCWTAQSNTKLHFTTTIPSDNSSTNRDAICRRVGPTGEPRNLPFLRVPSFITNLYSFFYELVLLCSYELVRARTSYPSFLQTRTLLLLKNSYFPFVTNS